MSHLKKVIENTVVYALNKLEGVNVLHYSVNENFNYDYERVMPGMSFRVIVKGGNKKEIANIIWMNKPLGILSCGKTKVKLKDEHGFKHEIHFDRIK